MPPPPPPPKKGERFDEILSQTFPRWSRQWKVQQIFAFRVLLEVVPFASFASRAILLRHHRHRRIRSPQGQLQIPQVPKLWFVPR